MRPQRKGDYSRLEQAWGRMNSSGLHYKQGIWCTEIREHELDKLIIDCSSVLVENPDITLIQLQSIQFHSARLCFALHCLRFKKLGLVPKRKRQRKTKKQ